jgi:signal transduction histidine kinase
VAQAISNLLGNAIQHGSHDQPIAIALDGTQPDRVILRVTNAGAIPPSTRGRLFDPFRGRDGRGANESGLGLGLYIVKQIAIAHGGDASLDSSDPERTSFVLELPRQPAARAG